MAYDMYTMHTHHNEIKLIGRTNGGEYISLDADQYFHYYRGYKFYSGMYEIFRGKPDQFSNIMHELLLKHNRSNSTKISEIAVIQFQAQPLNSKVVANTEQNLGTYR